MLGRASFQVFFDRLDDEEALPIGVDDAVHGLPTVFEKIVDPFFDIEVVVIRLAAQLRSVYSFGSCRPAVPLA